MSWLKLTNKETKIASQTFVKNKNKTLVKTYNTYSNQFYLDRTGSLHIYNLTLNDAGNYTCIRNNNGNLTVGLDVFGE